MVAVRQSFSNWRRIAAARAGSRASAPAAFCWCDYEVAAMSIREAVIAVVVLVMMAPQVIAADLKYALECGATKCVPSCDDDPDPVYRTRVARAVTGEIVVVHYAASGETYVRNDQYRDLRFWTDGKADNWSGVSIKRPDWTMVGRLQIDKTDRWVEYVEKLYQSGKLQSTATSVCRFMKLDAPGGKSSYKVPDWLATQQDSYLQRGRTIEQRHHEFMQAR
jgi:hypothetical protein